MTRFVFAVCCLFLAAFAACRANAAEARTFSFGGMELIALQDVPPDPAGGNRPGLLVGLRESDARTYLVDGAMINSINCFVLRKDGKAYLFDTGLGRSTRGGGMLDSLAAAGLTPGDIDAVIITHFHADHVGGLVDNGGAVFPAAGLLVPRVELEASPKAAEPFVAAYAGRLKTFEWDCRVVDGVTALDASGHTPGHTVFLVDGGLMIVSDLIHFAGIQLPLPDVAVTYDTDPVKAVATRRRLFDLAAREGYTVAAMHLPYPGVGVLSGEGTGYGFAPAK